MKKVTIVLLNWNGKHWLEKFLPSVLQSTYTSYQVLLVDNGSTDDSVAFVKKRFPQVKLLILDDNYGFTGGNNRAMDSVDTPYFVLLNTDVEVTPNWLEPLVARMDADETIASIQPKLLMFDQKDTFEYAGGAGGFVDQFYYPFCRGRIFESVEKDIGQYDDSPEIFWASGACCMVRKKVVDEIGLFEESFFAHMEEIDFCWRAKNHGYKVVYEPKSVVYHVGAGTLKKSNPRKTYLNAHNHLAMMYKNLPYRHLFIKVFMRLLLDGVWAAKALLERDFATIKMIIKAHWTFFSEVPFWRKRRRETYKSHKPEQLTNGYYHKSIIWQHFIRGKKKFSDL